MIVMDLLARFHDQGIELQTDGERLRVSSPKGVMTDALRAEIKKQKAEILAVIHDETQAAIEFEHIKFPVKFSVDWFPASFWIVETDADAKELALQDVPEGQIWTIPQVEKMMSRKDSAISEIQFIEEVVSAFDGKVVEIRKRPEGDAP